MTLDAWLERLRMMARCSVVELSPEEVGDLVLAVRRPWRIVQCEIGCKKVDLFNVVRMSGFARHSDGSTTPMWEHFAPGSFEIGEAIAHVDRLNSVEAP